MIDETQSLNPNLLQADQMNAANATHFPNLFSEERFEPCRVCGEPSSGWHCGAVTCEACKVI